jgi:glycosyltransferase involved in cell wall biosynthesis
VAKIIKHTARGIYRWFKRSLFGMKKFRDIDVFIDYHDFGFYDDFKHIKNAKKIAWFHSSINVFKERNFINKLERYNKTVVLTDEFIKAFHKAFPDQDANLVRIYNPIDIEQIKEKAKEKYKKITGDYFCSVARLSWDKDIITLLKGFDLFCGMHKKTNAKLVIVGDGKKAREYKAYAKKLKSSNQIIFVGATKNPFVYMKDAKANILSSFGEGFALVLVEGASVGTLNIASACQCGPRELLLNGKAGLLFEPGNAEDLAKCMNDVWSKKVDVKKMTDQATKSLKRFDADKIVKEIISLIS